MSTFLVTDGLKSASKFPRFQFAFAKWDMGGGSGLGKPRDLCPKRLGGIGVCRGSYLLFGRMIVFMILPVVRIRPACSEGMGIPVFPDVSGGLPSGGQRGGGRRRHLAQL